MFVQVLRGKVSDPAQVQAQADTWMRDLRPGAKGWLGATAGVAADGTYINLVRFESQQAAEANAARPEQGAWWTQAEKTFDGPVSFYNCPTVLTLLGGGSDDAGFVQVLTGRPSDPARAVELLRQAEPHVKGRQGLLGVTAALSTEGVIFQAVYFASEADAREGERQGLPPEAAKVMGEYRDLIPDLGFVDLASPILLSP